MGRKQGHFYLLPLIRVPEPVHENQFSVFLPTYIARFSHNSKLTCSVLQGILDAVPPLE